MTPTVGVEEEFLLVDPRTGVNVPAAEKVAAALPPSLAAQHRWELRRCMLELVTPVCTGLADLRESLTTLRAAAAEAAADQGVRLLPVGATPVADPDREPYDDDRFRAIVAHYGPVARDPAVCGCHIHVGVPSRADAVAACARLRQWLPVIQAMAVNSPLHDGADTGYASWRAIQLDRWPSLGPTPYLPTVDAYDDAVAALVASGVMLDASMVLWHARPSARYPTVEVRVADACPTADDAVLLAGLVRALVGTVLEEPPVPEHLLRAAHWNAARSGLGDTLLDARTGQAVPAWELVEELVSVVSPALAEYGDTATIEAGLARLRRIGTGADRQRAGLQLTPPGTTLTRYADGPLLVRGPFTLHGPDGAPLDTERATVALCRCGKSGLKPFCDGTHKQIGFRAPGDA